MRKGKARRTFFFIVHVIVKFSFSKNIYVNFTAKNARRNEREQKAEKGGNGRDSYTSISSLISPLFLSGNPQETRMNEEENIEERLESHSGCEAMVIETFLPA